MFLSPQPSDLSPQTSDLRPLNPGCFIVGSHVKKTTQQLERLLQAEGTCAIEVDVQRILDDSALLMSETLDTIRQVVEMGLTPVIYTSRQEIRLDDANQRQHLGQQVSDFLVDDTAPTTDLKYDAGGYSTNLAHQGASPPSCPTP